ncbi:MAG: hypothetical protein JWM01_807 [Arthrobacter sp.]|nr:hypothetical protein [Arthrobacter sp.]
MGSARRCLGLIRMSDMSDVQRPGASGGVFIGAIPDRKEGKSQRGSNRTICLSVTTEEQPPWQKNP